MLKVVFIGLLAAGSLMAQTASPSPTPAPAPSSSPAPTQATAAGTPQAPTARPQTPPAAKAGEPAKEAKKEAPEAALPPTTPVITIHGVCDEHKPAAAAKAATASTAAPAPCTTKITKQKFDQLVKMVVPPNQPVQPAARRNLAQRYVELLAIADAAKKAGIEKTPEYELLRLRALTEAYQRQLDEKYKTPPPAEVEAWYNQHKGDFESVTLRRVYVPKVDPAATKATQQDKEAFAKKTEGVANELRDRAVKGEDLDTLQKDAYSKLGLTTTPPSTQIGPVRKGALPAATDKEIFSLREGGVYKSDEPTAVVIYKVEKKQTLPLDTLKDEIARTLHRQKMEARLKEINDAIKTEYNDTYFGPPTPPTAAPLPPGDKR